MQGAREIALRENFFYFQSIVGNLMNDHAGEYALLRAKSLVEIFPKPFDALQAGINQFADGIFSVQKVIDRPLDLGFVSYGASDGAVD